MLQAFLSLPNDRHLPFTAKTHAKLLLHRLLPLEPCNSLPQHIMLSYAYTSTNQKPFVIALGKRLRDLGYDVWRDEEGSYLVNSTQSCSSSLRYDSVNDTFLDTLSSAVENSYLIVLCISPEYRDSYYCRLEAKYAKIRQLTHDVKIAYVMLNKDYTTKSIPSTVDGWLGLMIGNDQWYPCWETSQIESTASALAAIAGNNAKMDRNRIIVQQRKPVLLSKSTQTEGGGAAVGGGGVTLVRDLLIVFLGFSYLSLYFLVFCFS
jgi:hypothetical protein